MITSISLLMFLCSSLHLTPYPRGVGRIDKGAHSWKGQHRGNLGAFAIYEVSGGVCFLAQALYGNKTSSEGTGPKVSTLIPLAPRPAAIAVQKDVTLQSWFCSLHLAG